MAASSASKARPVRDAIRFVDLHAQQARIRGAIDAAIERVLAHGQYIMGPEVAELEGRLAQFCGAEHAVSCASGTDALLMVLMAKGVGPGDAVICPAFTYTATPEVIALLGATPVWVDVDPATFILAPHRLAEAIDTARRLGLRPRGIIAVDLFGLPADYAAIEAIARAHGLWVLADGAQSFGAAREGRRVGTFGIATAASFFPAKPLGCYGDGGAVLTDDAELAAALDSIRQHGRGAHRYDQVRIGINGRLDTLQAAILLAKLTVFEDEIAARQRVAQRYSEALADVVAVPEIPAGCTSVWAQYTIKVSGGRRDAVMRALAAQGIPTQVYYPKPLHHQAAYRNYPAGGALAHAEELPGLVLSLPMHPYLEAETQERIIASTMAALGGPTAARPSYRST
jgi:dTDP-4-amino-4,6-dideoxygalactose transaminase